MKMRGWLAAATFIFLLSQHHQIGAMSLGSSVTFKMGRCPAANSAPLRLKGGQEITQSEHTEANNEILPDNVANNPAEIANEDCEGIEFDVKACIFSASLFELKLLDATTFELNLTLLR
jgi:hypothetical protein